MKKSRKKARKAESPEGIESGKAPQKSGLDGIDTAQAAGGVEPAPSKGTSEPDAASDTVAALREKADRLEEQLLRAKADYCNLERRLLNQRTEAITYANAELMKSLLNVVDDFERSLAATADTDDLRVIVDGVRLVYENCLKALREQGLETIEALHKPFDPNVHEAVMQRPHDDQPPGTVVEEVAKGYRLRNRVLRPAKVIVSMLPKREEIGVTDGIDEESLPKD